MRRYRTEIVIPPDRMITLHLPTHFPEGRAIVIVHAEEPPSSLPRDPDEDHEDIEWWEEFEENDSATATDDPASPSGKT